MASRRATELQFCNAQLPSKLLDLLILDLDYVAEHLSLALVIFQKLLLRDGLFQI